MAQKYLDYAGLAKYDELIKELINSGDAELLVMIEELKDLVESSDSDTVDERIAEVNDALASRIAALESKSHDDHSSIAKAEIAALFMGGSNSTVTTADSAEDITSISAEDAQTTVIVATGDDALSAFTQNKTYQSISLGDGELNTQITLNAAEEISLDNIEINGRGENATGNGSVLFTAKELNVSNVTVDGETNYNVFEGNQDTNDSSAHIENLTISNITVSDAIKHNVVNVYTPAAGANITISDSNFTLNADNSNVLRMANYLNSDNVTITFKNCNWNYTGGAEAYAGLMLYQPSSTDAALTGDYSHLATWTIKFINCKYNNTAVTAYVGGYSQLFYTYGMNNTNTAIGDQAAEDLVGWNVVIE